MKSSLFSLLILAALVALHGSTARGQANADPLADAFASPPDSARPYVWWHWMGPNFSKEGITKDLEAMKASGIGGATIFNLTSAVQESAAATGNNPWPDQTFRSPKYWEALRFAAQEADRLGLEIGLHNTVGYSTTGGPWIDSDHAMKKVVWSTVDVDGGQLVNVDLAEPARPNYNGYGGAARGKSKFYRDIGVVAVPADQSDLAPADVVNLSTDFADGKLRWNAPQGRWKIYRFGYAPTGATPHPLPDDVIGQCLESDKMNADASRYHWQQVIDPVREHVGPFVGKSFRHMLIDSYEAGNQNWTDGFREAFQQRKGYDPLPWLASMGTILTGDKEAKARRVIGSKEQTARFEWDYRDVVAAMYYENGWQVAADALHAAGLKLQFEAYGGPFDTVDGSALADLPMVEYWTNGSGNVNGAVLAAARAAGRSVVGAEALTGLPANSRWTETPEFLKPVLDGSFGVGVNRLVLHHWVHQPFDDRYMPGMGMGWWGTHFGRNQTWFEPGKAFFKYIWRTQAMLQRGETPANFVSVGSTPAGGDVIGWRAFRAGPRVVDGQIVLPSGRSYRFLVVPHNGALLPDDVRQIEMLLKAGATVVSAKPDRSPSLSGFPACDEQVKALADQLWGDGTQPVREIGPGRLYVAGDVNAALADLKIAPAFKILTPNVGNVRIAHRRDGEAELFFVTNIEKSPRAFVTSFHVTGKQPELWDAQTGEISLAPVWRDVDGRTEVDLRLGAVRSVFVVLRNPPKAGSDHLTAVKTVASAWTARTTPAGAVEFMSSSAFSADLTFASGKTAKVEQVAPAAAAIDGPWKVNLRSRVEPATDIDLTTLASLSDHPTPSVKYFSGTAVYSTTFNIEPGGAKKVQLDLGKVADLARVIVNGKDLGVLWQSPFVVDVTSAVKDGANELQIEVTNTWHNRLVGDEQEPADFEWGKDRGPERGRAIKAYPDWFLKSEPRPSAGRKCFVVWYYHRQDTPLLPSGLIGPVRLVTSKN